MSDHFSKLYSFAKEVFESDNLDVARSMLFSLYDQLPEQNQKDIRDLQSLVNKSEHLGMRALFLERFGISEAVALEYIESRTDDHDLDRTDLDINISSLGPNYGSALTSACYKGELDIAMRIARHHDFKPVKLVSHTYRLSADGVPVKHKNGDVKKDISDAELKHLVDLMHRVGLDGVSGLADKDIVKLNLRSCTAAPTPFCGDLPTINSHLQLENPELAYAFQHESSKTPATAMYEYLPCWVHNDVLDQLQSARRYQAVREYIDSNLKAVYPLESLYANPAVMVTNLKGLTVPLPELWGSISLGLRPEIKDIEGRRGDAFSGNHLLQQVLDRPTVLGLMGREGHTLVVAKVSELISFEPARSLCPTSLEAAEQYAERFFPAPLFDAHYGRERSNPAPELGVRNAHIKEIMEELQGAARDHLLAQFPEKFFVDQCKKLASTLSPVQLTDAIELWKLDTRTIDLHDLSPAHVDALHSIGFKAHPQGHSMALDFGTVSKQKEFTFEHMVKFVQMGGWPSRLPKPSSDEEGMKLAVRTRTSNIYDVFVKAQGAERIVEIARTPAQWDLVKRVFDGHELAPYTDKLPNSVRRHVVEAEFGL